MCATNAVLQRSFKHSHVLIPWPEDANVLKI